jgi:hypothetical protein
VSDVVPAAEPASDCLAASPPKIACTVDEGSPSPAADVSSGAGDASGDEARGDGLDSSCLPAPADDDVPDDRSDWNDCERLGPFSR